MQIMFIRVVCGRIILRCLIVKTIIFDKCLFMGERSRVVVYLFLKNSRERFWHMCCEKQL